MGATSSLTPEQGNRVFTRRPALLWSVLLAIPLLAIVAFAVLQPVKVRPRIGLAPGFIFTDQNGAELTSEDLRGKFVFYNFTYTGCGAGCPQTSATMQAMQELSTQIDTGGQPVELVTVSLDPANDTPARLRSYAQQLGADTTRWHFVTGEPEQLKNVVGGGFGMFYEPDGKGGFRFEPMYVLVDGNGLKRAIYRDAAPDPAILKRDLGLVVDELKNSTGPGKLVYETAHLFLCYPK